MINIHHKINYTSLLDVHADACVCVFKQKGAFQEPAMAFIKSFISTTEL